MLSKFLFTLDPVNTMCAENDAHDEYDGIAEQLLSMQCLDPSSVIDLFDFWFMVSLDLTVAQRIVDFVKNEK